MDARTRPSKRRAWVWALLTCVVLVAAFAFYHWPWREWTIRANEDSAIATLETISSVQAQFIEGDRDIPMAYASSLADLSTAGLIDPVLGSGIKHGYRFSLSASGSVSWECRATPEGPRTGRRSFHICTDGVVRFAESGKTADGNSQPVR